PRVSLSDFEFRARFAATFARRRFSCPSGGRRSLFFRELRLLHADGVVRDRGEDRLSRTGERVHPTAGQFSVRGACVARRLYRPVPARGTVLARRGQTRFASRRLCPGELPGAPLGCARGGWGSCLPLQDSQQVRRAQIQVKSMPLGRGKARGGTPAELRCVLPPAVLTEKRGVVSVEKVLHAHLLPVLASTLQPMRWD